MFSWMQVFTAPGFSFSHESNDIANAIEPFAAVILLASLLALPVSSTHNLIGAVLGVGLVKSQRELGSDETHRFGLDHYPAGRGVDFGDHVFLRLNVYSTR